MKATGVVGMTESAITFLYRYPGKAHTVDLYKKSCVQNISIFKASDTNTQRA